MNFREAAGLLVVASSGVGVMVGGTFDASSDLHCELLARFSTPFRTSRLRPLPLLGAGRPRPFLLLIFEWAF